MNEIRIKFKDLHPAQRQIKDEAKRFNVLKCGRRFGKTDLNLVLAGRPLINGQRVGFWYPTFSDGKDVWETFKSTLYPIISKKNEQLRQITTITGGVLDMWTMEDPDSGRGFKYHRAIIDEAEKARHLKKAWEETIRATLTDYGGDAWFSSTPKFGTTYFKSVLFKNEERFDNWKSWKFTSYDNPHLPEGELDEIRSQLDPLVFACEYLAEDVDIIERPWAWAFEFQKHVAKDVDDPKWNGVRGEPIYLSFDFNVDPITCCVIQHYNDSIYVLEQIKLRHSNIYELCEVILTKYPNFFYFVTGDATGQNNSALVKDNLTYYRAIQQNLKIGLGQFRLPAANPKLEDNRILVNSLLSRYKVQIHPIKGQPLIFDLMNCGLNADGSILKGDRNDPKQQWDSLDCFRYYCNVFHRLFLRNQNLSKI